MVYSPTEDTVEGKQKMKRREKIKKAGKLTSQWELLRECKKLLEENSQVWEKRSREETVRIEEEKKARRLEIIKEKKKKFGKIGKKSLDKNENEKLKQETNLKLELAEIKQNLWRKYRDGGKEVIAPVRQRKEIPEGRKEVSRSKQK